MSSAAICGNHSGEGEQDSGANRKVFGFRPERRSPSSRNRVRDQPGTLFAFTPESRSPSPGIPNYLPDGCFVFDDQDGGGVFGGFHHELSTLEPEGEELEFYRSSESFGKVYVGSMRHPTVSTGNRKRWRTSEDLL